MRNILLMVLVAMVTLLHFLLVFSLAFPTMISTPFISLLSTTTPSLTLSPTPSGTPQPTNTFDPAIWAAIITSVAAIIAACIAAWIAWKQTRRMEEIEKKRREEQFSHDEETARKQREHDEEMARKQREHDEEMARQQKELELEYKVKEQQAQHDQDATKEAQKLRMLLASNTQRTKMYLESLHADPRISQLQILDMTRPLDISNIYVKVRVHQETRPLYELNDEIRRAEAQRDPNALIRASFKYTEQRSKSAIDPDEAIRTYKRCVFVGDPGAGKTTLLKYLTLKSAAGVLDKLPDLPIRVELNAFATSGFHDLLDYVAADWDERYGFTKSDARTAIEAQLKEGNALLLLDALDETVVGGTVEVAEQSYQQVTELIQRLATRYSLVPMVVTARKAGYHQRAQLTGFTELEVLDFRTEDIQLFVTKWFDGYGDPQKRANGNELNAKLARSPRIQALAANPLLLSLIVLVYEAQLDLPERRAELYKRCVEVLLREWDAKRNIRRRREFRPEHKQQLLGEIAWHFHLQGKRYFPVAELLQLVADFLPTIRLQPEQNSLILEEIANEYGLLKEQAREWQGFLHLTLQEYFVAQYVTDHQQQQLLLNHCGDPWWEEVIQLHAGLSTDISPLLHALLGDHQSSLSLPEDIFHTNIITAGRCLAASPTIKEAVLWKIVVERLFEVLLTTPYDLTYTTLAEVLVAIGGSEINNRLISLLSNEQIHSYVCGRIADAIGQLGDRTLAPMLVPLLSNEQMDFGVRGRIADAIGQLGDRTLAPTLVPLLSNEQIHSYVCGYIADAIGQLGDRTLAPMLVPLLSDEQIRSNVRGRIADAIGQLGDRTLAPMLVPLLSDEQMDARVRGSIAYAIGQLGDRTLAPTLVPLLSDEQIRPDVRGYIAVAIGQLGDRTLAPTLVPLLSNEQMDFDGRISIALAIGQLGDRTLAPTLVPLLSDEQMDSYVRGYIADAIGQLGDRTLAPTLVPLLSDGQMDARVRSHIADAIGQLGDHTLAPTLTPLLSNEQMDFGVRGYIANAIGQLGDRTLAPTLVSLLSNKQIHSYVRRSIAGAIGQLGEREEEIQSLLLLFPSSDIANSIYQTLWVLSLRMGVRIISANAPQGNQYQIVKWSTVS